MNAGKITPSFVELRNRGLIRVSGEDSFKFLQNLITNDLARLETQATLHSCLLNAQGKFLHDFYVSKQDNTFFIDCEGGARTQDLLKRLTIYRLRSKVQLEASEENKVYTVITTPTSLGTRFFEKPDLPQKDFDTWDRLRIYLAMADGSRDADIDKSTLSELNMDETSIDYKKGCYVGQELTARIHYRGLGKRHLFPVKFENTAPPRGTLLSYKGKNVGEMRSSNAEIGLALLKDELLPLSQGGFYMLDVASI